jgi:alkylation response protein AidB-like acyl-CoA dehydrogenase
MADGLELAYTEDQEAIRSAVDRFCTQSLVDDFARQSGQPFPRKLWQQLAELGVFYPAAPGHPEAGGALELCAICETLGAHIFPGPVPATYAALQVLEGDEAAAVLDGGTLVSLSSAGSTLLPWGTEADVFLVASGTGITSAHRPDSIEPVATLGGETWGRAQLPAGPKLPNAERAFIIANLACAAYLSGAAWRLLRDTSAHANTRKQFGKTLGEFQAVAHPLADCAIGLTAAQTLARAAACSFDRSVNDTGDDLQQAGSHAAAAVLSARRASLNTAFVCHQVFAGIGITLEGPVFHISRRIRQLASTPPTGAREQERMLTEAGLGVKAYENN